MDLLFQARSEQFNVPAEPYLVQSPFLSWLAEWPYFFSLFSTLALLTSLLPSAHSAQPDSDLPQPSTGFCVFAVSPPPVSSLDAFTIVKKTSFIYLIWKNTVLNMGLFPCTVIWILLQVINWGKYCEFESESCSKLHVSKAWFPLCGGNGE